MIVGYLDPWGFRFQDSVFRVYVQCLRNSNPEKAEPSLVVRGQVWGSKHSGTLRVKGLGFGNATIFGHLTLRQQIPHQAPGLAILHCTALHPKAYSANPPTQSWKRPLNITEAYYRGLDDFNAIRLDYRLCYVSLRSTQAPINPCWACRGDRQRDLGDALHGAGHKVGLRVPGHVDLLAKIQRQGRPKS